MTAAPEALPADNYPARVPEELTTLADLVTRPDFLAGLVAGTIALAAYWSVARGRRGWALALTAAALVGIFVGIGRRLGLTGGLVVLAVAGLMLGENRVRTALGSAAAPAGWLVAATGAILVTLRGGSAELGPATVALPLVIVAIGLGFRAWPGEWRHLVGPLMAITAFGIWTTVPEPNEARAVLGAALPLAVATLPVVGARMGPAGAFALAGLLTMVPVEGGITRPASIVGGIACVGVFGLVPILARTGRLPRLGPWTLLGVHAALVLIAARVIGLRQDALPALVAVVALWTATGIGLAVTARRR